ncbi:TBC1 domain family member 1-like isoform X2 [Ruditapes philippinarum]|uniref:TBC1 domain family member 1-like isoform X2 n=1 Tax=Ruditapes philippinarum TaxID=129788 RepID=UPI00295C058B|nr:TBC1 domain family member 1-like isoform X2 [Ruditapes philippinarum]
MENIQIRQRREVDVEKPVKFYFGSTSENINSIRCESPGSDISSPGSPDSLSWNESAMLSCWNSVHGLTEEVNKITESGSKGFLRSLSFSAKSLQSEILRTSSYANIRPVSEFSGLSGSSSENSPGNGFRRSVSYIDHNDNKSDEMSKQPMLSNCKRHTKLTNSSNNCRKRVSGTFNDTQRYSLSSLAEEAGSSIPSECQRRSIAGVPRKTNNNCKRRSCEPQNDRCQVSEKECAEAKSNLQQEIPEKNPAFRQSSYPGLRERTLIQNESKRHSMPLPLIYKKEMMNKVILSQNKTSDHVVEITDTVPELFQNIRGATQRDIFEEMEPRQPEPTKACYEVMYVGRAKVRGKKILSSHIDDLVMRLEAKEQRNSIIAETGGESHDRRRHKSDSSIKSLPTLLDETSVKENELQKMSQKTIFQGVELHNDSPTGSSDEVHLPGDTTNDLHRNQRSNSTDQLSDGGHSSSENVSDGLHSSHSGDQLKDMFHGLQHHPEGHVHFQDHDNHGNHDRSTNRTMLFRIGQSEISLISLDKKQTIIERKFKNISSVSQGNLKPDVFGFISREPGAQLLCHLLRCCSHDLTDEIMSALRTSFQNAYQQSRIQTQQICINCPLHQYHKLCQDINGQNAEIAYNLLCKRIQQLLEKDANELYHSLQNENPQCYEESVEVLMVAIRRLCEQKQKEHSHISETNKGSQKSDFYLIEMKDKGNKSTFDFLRNRAKKTLTSSFENLITNVHHKTEEMKGAFRHRSGTNESDGGSFSRSVDTPDMSPAPSPALINKDQPNFEFPSPPPSPTQGTRPRSATVGAVPDSSTVERVMARQEERQKKEKKEREKRRASESPMKHMFILANTGSPVRRSSGGTRHSEDGNQLLSPESHLAHRRGSWRQAIFNRVVTPAKHPSTETLEESVEEEADGKKKTSEELRALWRKAILETLLLIRMEKENIDLQARQDEADLKRQKLDYVEITPCLKEVTRLWDEMLNRPGRTTIKVEYEKLLSCVKQGVPQAKRGEVWEFLMEQHRLRYPSIEENTPQVDYNELLKQLTNHQHAILIDLGRTFPGHPYFSMQLGSGQLALFNLLKAYSLMDSDVGYCQGLSFVAGILLMHMEETVAFETWKHVMFNLGLRKQYRPNMIALQIQLYQLTRLLHDNYKDLYDHFEMHEIAPTLYAAPWFLTLFASQFPLGFVARVFDLILIQGPEVVFKVALVLLGNHKELIIQCSSFETVVEFIKTTLPEMGMIQMERVINQVFDMNISKQLQSYEVEYHVLKEEMMYSPQRGDSDLLDKLEQANQSLKQQNMELIEKLQHSHSHERSLEIMIHNFQMQEAKLKSHIRTLELERSALLNAVSKLKQLVPESEQLHLDITLPTLTPSMPCSPVHHGKLFETHGKITEHDGTPKKNDSIEKVQSSETVTYDKRKSARYHPERDS